MARRGSGPTRPEPPGGLELAEIPNTERALRRPVRRLGGPEGLVVCYEAGPCGYAPCRLLTEIGVRCDVVAPSELVPPAVLARASTAQLRLHSRHRALTARRKHSRVATIAASWPASSGR